MLLNIIYVDDIIQFSRMYGEICDQILFLPPSVPQETQQTYQSERKKYKMKHNRQNTK